VVGAGAVDVHAHRYIPRVPLLLRYTGRWRMGITASMSALDAILNAPTMSRMGRALTVRMSSLSGRCNRAPGLLAPSVRL